MGGMHNDFQPFRPSVPGGGDQDKHVPDPAFKTPEQAATAGAPPRLTPRLPAMPKTGGVKPGLWERIRHPNLSRKQIILISVIVGLLVVLVAGLLIWWFVIRKPEAPKPVPKQETKVEPAPAPTIVASRLMGVPVPPDLDKTPTTGVMIENSPDARPQSGLRDAGVVFEAIAEGGITRFLAIFQETKPAYIGPVRSVRPYYLDFLGPFDAPIAHAGGSGQALAEIKNQGFKDLDHGSNSAAYERVRNRFAPHNLYTSRDKLLTVQGQKGWGTSTFTSFARKGDKPSAAPNARSFDFNISSFLYNPHFDYNAASNSYTRSQAGKPHIDEHAGVPITPKTVVAMVMSHRYQGVYSIYGSVGGGQAFFFQDGMITIGTWKKPDRKVQYTFFDDKGAPLALNAGQTWISIVSNPQAVTFRP